MTEVPRDTQLVLYWTARIDYDRNKGVASHSHDQFHQLLVLLEGQAEGRIGSDRFFLQKGDYVYFPKGVEHHFRFLSKAVTLDFKFAVPCAGLEAWIGSHPLYGPSGGTAVSELKHWFKLSLLHRRHPRPHLPLLLDSGFKGTLLTLLAGSAGHQETASLRMNEESFPIAKYIRERLAEEVTVNRLAEAFNFHPHYLISMFKERVGMSPIQYLQHVRLQKAEEYLEFTSLSITEIAEKLGWSTHYFSRLFQQKKGIAPSAYRDQTKSAQGEDIILQDSFRNEWRITELEKV